MAIDLEVQQVEMLKKLRCSLLGHEWTCDKCGKKQPVATFNKDLEDVVNMMAEERLRNIIADVGRVEPMAAAWFTSALTKLRMEAK